MDKKISAVDFTEEIYTAIKDCFVAKVFCGVDEICVEFLSGQKFVIKIEEY